MKKETTMHVGRFTRMGLIEEEGCLTWDGKNLSLSSPSLISHFLLMQ